jgi:hypothetical protein
VRATEIELLPEELMAPDRMINGAIAEHERLLAGIRDVVTDDSPSRVHQPGHQLLGVASDVRAYAQARSPDTRPVGNVAAGIAALLEAYGRLAKLTTIGLKLFEPMARHIDPDVHHIPTPGRGRLAHSCMTTAMCTTELPHRAYASSADEACYICALLFEIKMLRMALVKERERR